VDGDATDVVPPQLDLAGVHAGPDGQAGLRHLLGQRHRRPDGPGRTVEGGEDAVATVAEVGQITNGVVQALFDVKVERASRILSDLVDRGVIVKTSAHKRGRRVTYGPGPKFPTRRQPRGKRQPDPSGRFPFEAES
jgi:hypothetical protein